MRTKQLLDTVTDTAEIVFFAGLLARFFYQLGASEAVAVQSSPDTAAEEVPA